MWVYHETSVVFDKWPKMHDRQQVQETICSFCVTVKRLGCVPGASPNRATCIIYEPRFTGIRKPPRNPFAVSKTRNTKSVWTSVPTI